MTEDGASRPELGDAERLRALAATELLDSPVEESFERYTRTLATALGVPVALVSLVTDDRQFFKSSLGLDDAWASRRETPLSHSFCQHVVADDGPLVVPDAREDPRFQDNPAIEDLGVVAYAGVPLHGPGGRAIGALCAIDTSARTWSDDDLQLVQELAQAMGDLIAMRVAAVRRRAGVLDLSHQLRTALAGLRLEAEDLQASLDPGLAERAGGLVAGLEQMTVLVEAALHEAEREPLGHERDLALPEVVEDVAARVREDSRARDREVVVAPVDGPVPSVRVPPAALSQVLHGVVGLLLDHGAGAVALSVAADGAAVRVRVQDEGEGLPEHVTRSLSGRQDSDRTSDRDGGPSLAEQAARSLGGRLVLSSTRPTTLDLLLPVGPGHG